MKFLDLMDPCRHPTTWSTWESMMKTAHLYSWSHSWKNCTMESLETHVSDVTETLLNRPNMYWESRVSQLQSWFFYTHQNPLTSLDRSPRGKLGKFTGGGVFPIHQHPWIASLSYPPIYPPNELASLCLSWTLLMWILITKPHPHCPPKTCHCTTMHKHCCCSTNHKPQTPLFFNHTWRLSSSPPLLSHLRIDQALQVKIQSCLLQKHPCSALDWGL